MKTVPIRVLLVEDNEAVLPELRERFTKGGGIDLSVASLKDAASCLDSARFAVVLFGVTRADAHAAEAIAQLAAESDAPVIALLRDLDDAAETMCFRAGAQDVLSKGEAGGRVLLHSLRAAIHRQTNLLALAQSLKLAQAERVTAVSRRAAAAAHDIDNPASFILANQSMLKDDLVKLGIVFASLRGYMAEEADSDRRAILDSVLPREALDNILRDMKEMLDDNNIGLSRIRALTVELRNLGKEHEANPPARVRKAAAVRSRARILIIDDEPSLLKVYRRMLEPLHEVVAVHGGAEALNVIAESPDFDVVMCDLTMPDLDGPAIHRAVMASSPELAERFVFCTGGAFTVQTREFIANVDNLFLEKPITREKLLAAVDRVRGSVPTDTTPHSSAPPSE